MGTKEIMGILAILVILFMMFEGSQESKVVVIDRPTRHIPTPVFIGQRPRRHFIHHGRHHGGHHGGHHGPVFPFGKHPKIPKKFPKAPIKFPKVPIKFPKIPVK